MASRSTIDQSMFAILVLLVIATFCTQEATSTRVLREKFSWKAMDYAFPGPEERERALRLGSYVPKNGLPVGIETWGDRMFLSVPRWKEGIPSTLNSFSLSSAEKSPLLEPYPDWPSNKEGDCARGMTTVYRIKADKCNRLWALDTGTVGIGNTTRNVCPYALNVFDLTTNKRIRRYQFRPQDTNAFTFIANIAIDIGKGCEDTMAYMSDELGFGLICYSWAENKSWRFEHGYFYPDPLKGDFNIAGLNFQWADEGIFGMALSPINYDGFRTLYFGPLASEREFAVSTKILRDESKVEESYHDFHPLEERTPLGHVTAQVMNDDGLMLFNLVDHNAIGCWHSSLPYHESNMAIVDKDDVGLVFPCDVKIDRKGMAWVFSDRMPVFMLANLDQNDVNFRVYQAPVQELVRGTVCDVNSRDNQLYYDPNTYDQVYTPDPWWHAG